mmetsp:Transcript_15658/g.35070  ORF Transcript_15658/g.35070 Transcript_15658/m.35070 type:complete len:430 (-) Transcript_15658:64-1353(-)
MASTPPPTPPSRGFLPNGCDIRVSGGPLPSIIPRLSDDEYEYGNVRRGDEPGGGTIERVVSREVAEAIPMSRRRNRKGLVYDASFPGFSVTSWPYVLPAPVVGEGGHRVWLEGRDGEEPTLLDVHYDPNPDPSLCLWTEDLYAMHKTCREGDPSAGGMTGVGQHLRRDGHMGNFVTTGDREHERRVAASITHRASEVFTEHFSGRGVGYKEMLAEQGRLLGGEHQKCWAVSSGFGSSEHVDADGSRSYAVWVARHGHASQSGSWWLLFPRHGVAVQLIHGTWISWDGRAAEHCTAVPAVDVGDSLMSLFCALPKDVVGVRERVIAGVQELRERSSPNPSPNPEPSVGHGEGHALFARLRDGVEVVYRWTGEAPEHLSKRARVRWGKAHVRWVQGKVVSLTDTHVTIHDKHGGKAIQLSVQEVGNQLYIP